MILLHTFWHEWRNTLWRPAAMTALFVFVCALAYAAFNGRVELGARADSIAAFEADVAAANADWREQLKALQSRGPGPGVPPWAGSAMEVALPASLPPAPLADFAIGQSDLLPSMGALSLWDPDVRAFSKYELDDPVALALGAFDLGKAVVFVLPLVLIVLCFDVLSADRDSDRLALVIAQGARLRQLFWSRLAVRATVVLTVLFVVASIALIAPIDAATLGQRLPYAALWALGTLLYSAFWLGLIALVASANRGGAFNAAALLLAWVAFAFLIPATVTSVAEVAYPTPSRLSYLADAREVEIETELAESDATARFVLDHPDLVVDRASEMPAYVRTAFLVTRAVDEATRPTLLRFEQAAADRERSLRFMRYLSPAIAVHGVLLDLAGTSARRHRDYMADARDMKARFAERAGPFIVAGRRLPLEEAKALPQVRAAFDPATTVLHRQWGALAFLACLAVVLTLSAHHRLARMSVRA